MSLKLKSSADPGGKGPISNQAGLQRRAFDGTIPASYEKKKILVTGANGYLGARLVEKLSGIDCEIMRLSRNGNFTAPVGRAARFKDRTADLRDAGLWHDLILEADILFHLAAQTSAVFSEKNPSEDFSVNCLPVCQLLETCRKKKKNLDIIFAGTVTQAGIPERLPVDETHPDRPATFYDLHKLMAEQYLKLYADRGLVRAVSLRLPNVYGPSPASGSPERGVLNQIIRKALAGEKLSVYGPGTQMRDYLYIEDALRAFLLAGDLIGKLNGQHCVIGTGKGYTLWDAFHLAADRAKILTGRRAPVEAAEPPSLLSAIECRNFVANPYHFTELTGWVPAYSFDEGIDATLRRFHQDSKPEDRGAA